MADNYSKFSQEVKAGEGEVADYVGDQLDDRFYEEGDLSKRVFIARHDKATDGTPTSYIVFADDEDDLEEGVDFVNGIAEDKEHDIEWEERHGQRD